MCSVPRKNVDTLRKNFSARLHVDLRKTEEIEGLCRPGAGVFRKPSEWVLLASKGSLISRSSVLWLLFLSTTIASRAHFVSLPLQICNDLLWRGETALPLFLIFIYVINLPIVHNFQHCCQIFHHCRQFPLSSLYQVPLNLGDPLLNLLILWLLTVGPPQLPYCPPHPAWSPPPSKVVPLSIGALTPHSRLLLPPFSSA